MVKEPEPKNQDNKMHSEELFTLNIALQYCDELKTQLRDAIGHIGELNKRYNHIDYMANFLLWEKSRGEFLPYIDHLQSQLSLSPNLCLPFSPAVSSLSVHHRQRLSPKKIGNSTPKVSAHKIRRALELSPIKKPLTNSSDSDAGGGGGNDGPISAVKRTVQEITYKNNTITVRTLKVQRNIETMLNHLKVLQKIHQRNHAIALEQSLYQSCNNSMCDASASASPGQLGHTQCNQNWSMNNSFSSNFNTTTINMTPNKNQSHKYVTPLRKLQKQAMRSNRILLLRSC